MIKTIYQFGTYLSQIEEMQHYFEMSAAPYPEHSTDELVIIAEIRNKKYTKLSIERYSTAYNSRYLYRELASSRSTSIVPTLHFYFVPKESDLDTSIAKFLDKLQRSIDSNKAIYKNYFDPTHLIEGVAKEIKHVATKVLSEKKNYLFTLRIDDSLLGDIPEIKKILVNNSFDKYFKDGRGQFYQGKDKVCAVTYEAVEKVWGRVDTLGFTVNDISFSRNGFNATDSYKMFPVSPEVVQILEGTKRALMKKLSYSFAGIQYFLLPHFLAVNDVSTIENLIRRFVHYLSKPEEPGFDPMTQSIINSETVFNSILQDPDLGHNSIYYDIFFFEQKQAQFAIKLHVSDVIPSRFRIIRENKNRIALFYRPITNKIYKSGPWYFTPNFYYIKDYFSTKKEKETFIEPYFFKIVEAIFYRNTINEEQLLKTFLQKIRASFKNLPNDKYSFYDHVKYSLCIHQFFQQLQLFRNMKTSDHSILTLTADEFVEQHKNLFNHPLKKASFFLGCATEKLLNHQDRRYSGNKPFLKNLNNLYVDFRSMQEIFNRLRKKATEYEKDTDPMFYQKDFYEMLQKFAVNIAHGDDELLSKTELSFSFSLGLVLEKEFTRKRIEEAKERHESKSESIVNP